MKISGLLVLTLFSTISLYAQEEKAIARTKESIFRPAIILGFNASQVDGDGISGYRKFGVNAGAGAFVMLPKNFSFNFEILYSQKGSKKASSQDFLIDSPDKIQLDYVDVPILFNYHDKNKQKTNDIAIFGIGVVVNSLVKYKIENGISTPDKEVYNRFSLEALANLIFVFAKRFGANIRFTYTITDILSNPYESQRSNVLSLRLMYIFK